MSSHRCGSYSWSPSRRVSITDFSAFDYITFVQIGDIWTEFCASVSLQEYEDDYYDDVLMNCSDTESIKGGFVTYSQVILHF